VKKRWHLIRWDAPTIDVGYRFVDVRRHGNRRHEITFKRQPKAVLRLTPNVNLSRPA
jgi:hypothetical protein